jgi:hypothetical protein
MADLWIIVLEDEADQDRNERESSRAKSKYARFQNRMIQAL